MSSISLKTPFWRSITRIEVLLFLGLWLTFGVLINAKNVAEFDFQQTTIEAIVDYQRVTVENLKNWPATGDVFGYDGHTYSNKQPGAAIIGSIAYAGLKLFGFSYDDDKLLTGALIIFFTASLFTALAGVCVFRIGRYLDSNESTFWPLAAALVFGLGTTSTAYSGLAHHDTLATAFLVIAFYLTILTKSNSYTDQTNKLIALGAGFLLGLTITTSMLHFFMVVVVGIYFLSLRRWKLVPPMMIGGFASVLPMLIYNAVCFGNPFLPPAVANAKFTGYNPEVFFYLDLANFLEKLRVYRILIDDYDPVLWVGLVGLFFVSAHRWREVLAIFVAVSVLFLYVANVEGLGTCAYGPRYLLPIMPFLSLGVVGLRRIPTVILRLLAGAVLLVVGIKSVVINVIGAMYGAMYCNMAGYAFPGYFADFTSGKMPVLLIAPWLVPFIVGVLALIVIRVFVIDRSSVDEDTATAQEDLTSQTGTGHQIARIVMAAVIVLILLFPLYAFFVPSAWVQNVQPTVATSPEPSPTPDTRPFNAFETGTSNVDGQIAMPRGIAADGSGNFYIADTANARIVKVHAAGGLIFGFGTKGTKQGEFQEPNGVAVDRSGNIYVADAARGTLIKFGPEGGFLKEWSGPEPGFYGLRDIALAPNGHLYIVDQGRTRIVRFDPETDTFTTWGQSGSESGQFVEPTGIGIADNKVFVADLGNNRIQIFDLEGVFIKELAVPVWEKYPWHYPDVAFDENTKTVYLTNGWKEQILAMDLDGNQSTGEVPSDAVLRNPSALLIVDTKKDRRLIVLNTGSAALSTFDLKPIRGK